MNPTENHLTIGLDLGDLKGCALSGRQHAVCVLNAAGDIVAEESIPNTREVPTAFAARYLAATFVLETGTHSPWVSRLRSAFQPAASEPRMGTSCLRHVRRPI